MSAVPFFSNEPALSDLQKASLGFKLAGGKVAVSGDNLHGLVTVIPGATMARNPTTGNDFLVVPHTMETTKLLNNIGAAVPSPIIYEDFSNSAYTPLPHQLVTMDFLTRNLRAFCLNAMGTGKTSAALWAADFLLRMKMIHRVVILAPKTTLQAVWEKELQDVLPGRSYYIATGTGKQLAEAIESQEFDFIVANHDKTKKAAAIIAASDVDLVLVDEASAYRNSGTDRHKALKIAVGKNGWLWLLTGSPCPNAPTDVWALCKLVDIRSVPSFSSFRDLTMYQATKFKWLPRKDGHAIAWRAMQPSIRFRTEDCEQLPPQHTAERNAPLTVEQEKQYSTMKAQMKLEAEGQQITAANAAVQMGKLLQICAGVVKTGDEDNVIHLPCKPRLDALQEIIESTDGKVLVFTAFKAVQAMVLEHVRKWGYSSEMVNGETSMKDRQEYFSEFQDSRDPHVLVLHPKTAAHGLTLTAATATVWWGPIFSAELYEQANARTHRHGQREETMVFQLAGSAVERAAYSTIDKRLKYQGAVLDLYKQFVGG